MDSTSDKLLDSLIPGIEMERTHTVLHLPGEITIWTIRWTIRDHTGVQETLFVYNRVVGDMSNPDEPVTAGLHMGLVDHTLRVSYIREDRTTYLSVNGDTVFSYVGPSAEGVARALINYLYGRSQSKPLSA